MTIDPKALSLMDLESHIDALLDTTELVDPAQESAFIADLESALTHLPEKRESVAQMILFMLEQAEVAKGKKELYGKREKRLRRQAASLGGYVLNVIRGKGKDPKTDRYRKLQGTTVTLAPWRCPVSTVVTDATLVPSKFKTAVIKMSAADWESLAWDKCDACKGDGEDKRLMQIDAVFDCPYCNGTGRSQSFLYPFLSSVTFPVDEIKLTPIKEALEKGETVPGARLETDKLRLEIL